MGIKLNVGISRKLGQRDFGSAGASLNMEVELDAALLSDPAAFRREVQAAYDIVTALVLEQLSDDALAAADVPAEDRRDGEGRREPVSQVRADRTKQDGVYHAPVESNYRDDGQGRGGVTRRNRPGLPPTSRAPERERAPERNGTNGEAPRKRFEGKPKSGSQLYAYLKDRDQDCRNLFKNVEDFGKRYGFPKSFRDWNEAEVRDGLEEAERLQAEGRDR